MHSVADDLPAALVHFFNQHRVALGYRGVHWHRSLDAKLVEQLHYSESANAQAVVTVRVVAIVRIGTIEHARRSNRFSFQVHRVPLQCRRDPQRQTGLVWPDHGLAAEGDGPVVAVLVHPVFSNGVFQVFIGQGHGAISRCFAVAPPRRCRSGACSSVGRFRAPWSPKRRHGW